MVHRPSDSRLLSNLLAYEKDYSKSLSSFLDASHASLASFQAYASASSPPSSHAILAVAGSFAGADEALTRYAQSVDRWRAELEQLKKLEDEVGIVIRDREILVTRLIKASKSQKPTRESLLPPTSPSATSLTLSITSNPSAKLTAAQAELQACEAHLASKEREVDQRRLSAIKEGLSVRCKAMVECGWAWGEMGKEGLRALEEFSHNEDLSQVNIQRPILFPTHSPSHSNSSSQDHLSRPYPSRKPLPDPSSDTSLSPSQSASQINVPAAYKLDESIPIVPTGGNDIAKAVGRDPYITPGRENGRHVLSRRITEESLQVSEDGEESKDVENSSAEEDVGPVQIVENVKFSSSSPPPAKKRNTLGRQRKFSIRRTSHTGDQNAGGSSMPSTPVVVYEGKRERKTSTSGFLGSIMGLFKGKSSDVGSDHGEGYGHDKEDEGTIGKGGKWKTRTDRNIKAGKRGGGLSDDEDEDAGVVSEPGIPASSGTFRRKTLSKAKGIASGKRGEELGGERSLFVERENVERWRGTGDEDGTVKAKRRRKASLTEMNTKLNSELGREGTSLSRNSSIASAASAPPALRSSTFDSPFNTMAVSSSSSSSRLSQPRRSSSLRVTTLNKHDRRGSLPVTVNGMGESVSLMSIVEGVTNVDHNGTPGLGTSGSRKKEPAMMEVPRAPGSILNSGAAGSGGMHLPKAPPPLKRSDLEPEGIPIIVSQPRSRTSSLPTSSRPSSSPSGLGTSVSSTSSGLGRSSLDAWEGGRSFRPAKSPLKSALRTSRSPSPSPLRSAIPGPSTSPGPAVVTTPPSPLKSKSLMPNGTGLEKEKMMNEGDDDDDDKASVSSYETGHEAFDEEEEESHPLPPPPPPAHDGSETDLSDASTTTPVPSGSGAYAVRGPASSTDADVNGNGTGTQRRKSVRISKLPTFSSTPPALDDDGFVPDYSWGPPTSEASSGDGWIHHGREDSVKDIWEDSSEEDEEYTRARRMLGRVAKRASRGLDEGASRYRQHFS